MSKVIARLRCHCGASMNVTEEDLGFEELECGRCGLLNYVPETIEDITRFNDELIEEQRERDEANALYRVMVEGEDGTVFCVKNGLPNDDLLEVILDGFRARYPDAKRVFLEQEESTIRGFVNYF